MRVASEAVTFWCELGKGDTALAYKNRACAGCLCSIEAQVPRFPDPRPCPSLGREKSCRAAPRKAGAAGTLTRSPSPKARHLAEAGVVRDGDSKDREPWDVREGLPRPQVHSLACLYKTVFRGISRLLNYSFASATRCLCFPHSPAASLKLI